MGSWNAGCFLTHTPIQDGDPVVALFLLSIDGGPKPHRATRAHRTTPVGLPFRGTYDGYGWLLTGTDPRDDQIPFRALETILAAGAFVESTPGGRAAEAFDAGRADLAGVHALQEEGRLFAKVPAHFSADGKARFATALCHAAAWDLLVQRPVQDGDPEDALTVHARVAPLFSFLDVLDGRRLPPDSDGFDGMEGWEVLLEHARTTQGLRATASLHYGPVLTYLQDIRLANAARRDPKVQEDWEGTARLLTEVVHVHAQMGAARRFWAPGPGISTEEDWALLSNLSALAHRLALAGQAKAEPTA